MASAMTASILWLAFSFAIRHPRVVSSATARLIANRSSSLAVRYPKLPRRARVEQAEITDTLVRREGGNGGVIRIRPFRLTLAMDAPTLGSRPLEEVQRRGRDLS
jgi:hypothetical protein